MRGVDPVGRGDAIRARVPEVLRMYSETRRNVLAGGVLDAEIKELCARYLAEDPEVVDFEDSDAFDERQHAALGWARAIAWDPSLADDALWELLHAQFTDPELVELGYYMAIIHGQLHWLRTLGVRPERHEVLAF
jgi:uncharacterized protein YciW